MFAPLPGQARPRRARARRSSTLWERERDVRAAARAQNADGPRFSFIDGPVTANKSLAVHTAWGRTLKDVFQRYKALRGFDQRYQNGFDCQGLWIEVGVERELGLNSKREIEEYGLAEFARKCREVVVWSSAGADAAARSGSASGWTGATTTSPSPTRTSSTSGGSCRSCTSAAGSTSATARPSGARAAAPRSPPTSCSAATSDRADPSLFVRFPLLDRPGESLVVWTTTPWTLPANVAAAVNPDAEYGRRENGEWVAVARYPGRDASPSVVHGLGARRLALRGPVRRRWPGRRRSSTA